MGSQQERRRTPRTHGQTHGLLNGNIDDKVEKMYFNLAFHGEETGREKSMALLMQVTLLLIHFHTLLQSLAGINIE